MSSKASLTIFSDSMRQELAFMRKFAQEGMAGVANWEFSLNQLTISWAGSTVVIEGDGAGM